MNVKDWNWLNKEGFSLIDKTNRVYVFSKKIEKNLRQIISLHSWPDLSKWHIILSIELDVSPVLCALTNENFLKDKHQSFKQQYDALCTSSYYTAVQEVSVLPEGFQSPGWSDASKIYVTKSLEIEFNKDFSQRFVKWFYERSMPGQLIKLLEEGDIECQREIERRVLKKKSPQNIFQRLFSNQARKQIDSLFKLPEIPSDGVPPDSPIKHALLGGLFFLQDNTTLAKKHVDLYWEKLCLVRPQQFEF